MEKRSSWENTSPLDSDGGTRQLVGHVVSLGESPRILGYDVASDLVCHYSFAEMMLLMLTGELPERDKGRAFDIALGLLSPVSVAEAPCHAAVLARIAGADTTGLIGVASVALAEQTRVWLSKLAPFLEWLDHAEGAPPTTSLEKGDRDGETAEPRRLLRDIGSAIPGMEHDLERDALVLAVLHHCGLTTSAQIEAAVVMARLPCVMAEVHAYTPGKLDEYPVNLPHFRYEE